MSSRRRNRQRSQARQAAQQAAAATDAAPVPPPQILAGQGSGIPTGPELRLEGRAVNEQWPQLSMLKKWGVVRTASVLQDPNMDPKHWLRAASIVTVMNSQEMEQQRRDSGAPASQVNVNVGVNVGVSNYAALAAEMSDDELARLEALASRAGAIATGHAGSGAN